MDKIQKIQDDISRTKIEIDAILEGYETLIKSKLNELDDADELRRKDIIEELFTIKDEICMATNQYSYPVTKFIANFVKDFDQKKS